MLRSAVRSALGSRKNNMPPSLPATAQAWPVDDVSTVRGHDREIGTQGPLVQAVAPAGRQALVTAPLFVPWAS